MLKNLCPHAVDIVLPSGTVLTIRPSGNVARCEQFEESVGNIDGIPVMRYSYGEVTGLPDKQDGVTYIVSKIVAQACRDRDDLLMPGTIIKDENGSILGCRCLVTP